MNQNLDYKEEYGDGTFELQTTILPNECNYPLDSSSYRNAANVRYLFRHGIINWPNFTHCLPNCGLCTQFASDHAYQIYNLVVIGFLLPFISLCGLCGNILSAFIYSRPALRHSYTGSIYLSALGCSDTAIFFKFINFIWISFTFFVYPAGMIAQTCSVYFTIIAAVDCFVQVCMPIKIKRLFSSQLFTKCLTSGILAFAFLYNIPHCFESILLDCWHPTFQSQSVEVCPAPLRFHPTYMLIYYKYMYAIFLAIGPLFVLIVLNIIVIIATVFCKKGNSADNLALILVVLLFILCNTVALLINIFETHLSSSMSWRINYIIDISNFYNFSHPFRCTFSRHFGPTISSEKSHSSICGHSPVMRHHTIDYTNRLKIHQGGEIRQNGFILQKYSRSQSLSTIQSTQPFIKNIESNKNCFKKEENKIKKEFNKGNVFTNLINKNKQKNLKTKIENQRKSEEQQKELIFKIGENSRNRIKINNYDKIIKDNPHQQTNKNEDENISISYNKQREEIESSSSASSGISLYLLIILKKLIFLLK
ncbi:G_PROTEIN_RECEP_F1_2 domain-containing protein [Meloidogyne graminicola]|uniref:G_PROTEIN_RECEP_F1_2 domain-containing protein n=1 Tax=Meloidogyne graminicola TaxID=189291 RepID=A0A8S9ZB26_9BILA|nr:G_PROTEIN_RECEP_F1_2 domain-containing protein [Meloidogyne graminicola]